MRSRIRVKRNTQSLENLWGTINYTNICTMGVPKGEKRKNGEESIFEWINNGPKLFRFDKRYESTHPKSSTNSKPSKFKKTHIERQCSPIVERQIQRKHLESSKRQLIITNKGSIKKLTSLLIRNLRWSEYDIKCWEKENKPAKNSISRKTDFKEWLQWSETRNK